MLEGLLGVILLTVFILAIGVAAANCLSGDCKYLFAGIGVIVAIYAVILFKK